MPEIRDFCVEFADLSASRARNKFERHFNSLKGRCESPIEEALLAALLFHTTAGESYFAGEEYFFFLDSHFRYGTQKQDFPGLFCYLQAEIGKYRADFLIVHQDKDEEEKFFVIECDGHNFHEKTKEQAQRDKARDRYFSSLGIIPIRFTGGEIWRNAANCIFEIEQIIIRSFSYVCE